MLRRGVGGMLLASVSGIVCITFVLGGRGESAVPEFLAWARGARLLNEQDGIRQVGESDCGPAALAHALRRLGMNVRYPDPRSPLRPGEEGCRMDRIGEEAERLGASSRLRRVNSTELDALAMPAVLHLNRGHYVVLEARTAGGNAVIHDPSLGRIEQSPRSLANQWSGWALELALPPPSSGAASQPDTAPRRFRAPPDQPPGSVRAGHQGGSHASRPGVRAAPPEELPAVSNRIARRNS